MTTLQASEVARNIVVALERMTFVVADSIDEQAAAELPPVEHHARIVFEGQATKGEIHVSAGSGFLVELASSLLGVEEDEVDAEHSGVEALTELANVIAGVVVQLLGSEKIAYQIGIPERIDESARDEALADLGEPSLPPCYLESMGQLLVVRIFEG